MLALNISAWTCKGKYFHCVEMLPASRDGMRHREKAQHDLQFSLGSAEIAVTFEKAPGLPGCTDLRKPMSRSWWYAIRVGPPCCRKATRKTASMRAALRTSVYDKLNAVIRGHGLRT